MAGGAIWPIYEHKNLHFDSERANHMTSKTYDESGYVLSILIC